MVTHSIDRTNHLFELDAHCAFEAFIASLAQAGFERHNFQTLARLNSAEFSWNIANEVPSALLYKLFVLREPVSITLVLRCLHPFNPESLVQFGILERDGSNFIARAHLGFYHDYLLLQDSSTAINPVSGVGGISERVASLTPRRNIQSMLDIGTGCGIQSLLASRHATSVVATDISARALNLAAANARINRISNILFRQGSLFDPVAGEQFELIVANLPYVISPESRLVYRDSGMHGDSVSEMALRAANNHLCEGGLAVLCVEWHYDKEEAWSERPLSWIQDLKCDIWWIRFDRADPVRYTSKWIALGLVNQEQRARAKTFADWLAYYQALGANHFSSGIVLLRKRSGSKTWQRFEDFTEISGTMVRGDLDDQIETIFAAEDLLTNVESEDDLLDMRFTFRAGAGIRLTQEHICSRWHVTEIEIRNTTGIPFSTRIDPAVLTFLRAVNPDATLRNILRDVANSFNLTPDVLRLECLTILKHLLRSGVIVPSRTS